MPTTFFKDLLPSPHPLEMPASYELSEPAPLPFFQRNILKKFLRHVVHGEHDEMQEMLLQDIQLLFQRESVTDYSGREFASISGFEYALWALDKHQWDDMLACLPWDENGYLDEEERMVVEKLQHQYIKVRDEGVIYRLNGMIQTESHYDFAIIVALQEQVSIQNADEAKDWLAIDKQWRTGVGGAQRLAPVHIVDEYCSPTPFYPKPKFDCRPIPSKKMRQFYNWGSEAREPWFKTDSQLGVNFAIYKEPQGLVAACGGRRGRGVRGMTRDMNALRALYNRRLFDFSQLEAQLEFLQTVEEQAHTKLGAVLK